MKFKNCTPAPDSATGKRIDELAYKFYGLMEERAGEKKNKNLP